MTGQVVTQPFLPSPWMVPLPEETLSQSSGFNPGVAAWPGANRGLYIPIGLPVNQRLKSMSCYCAVTNSANFDLGLYDAAGNRLASLGSTALSVGVNTWTPPNPTLLLAGTSYFVAMAAASTSSTFARITPNTSPLRAGGFAQQASALALPATATFAQMASAYVPLIVLNFVETPA